MKCIIIINILNYQVDSIYIYIYICLLYIYFYYHFVFNVLKKLLKLINMKRWNIDKNKIKLKSFNKRRSLFLLKTWYGWEKSVKVWCGESDAQGKNSLTNILQNNSFFLFYFIKKRWLCSKILEFMHIFSSMTCDMTDLKYEQL